MTNPSSTGESGKLLELAGRVINGTGCDNKLDVLIEVALFEPCSRYATIRANDAGTKVIYKDLLFGKSLTCWAPDWTLDRVHAALALRARAHTLAGDQ